MGLMVTTKVDPPVVADGPGSVALSTPPANCTLGAAEPCAGPSQCAGTSTCVEGELGSPVLDACYCRSDCTATVDNVHLISAANILYAFSPSARVATPIAALSCAIRPVSLAIDRSGVGRVLSDQGELYRLTLSDGTCAQSAFAPGKHGFFKFGMGYSSDMAGGQQETLYIAGDHQLGALDTVALRISATWRTSLPASELTGTADGRLFAYAGTEGRLAELDKTTGAVRRAWAPAALGRANDFALAGWRGNLWLFADARAYLFDLTQQTLQLAIADLGFDVVGAGVSTCASHLPAGNESAATYR